MLSTAWCKNPTIKHGANMVQAWCKHGARVKQRLIVMWCKQGGSAEQLSLLCDNNAAFYPVYILV